MLSRVPRGFARRGAVFLFAGSIVVGGAAYAAHRTQAGPQPDGSGVTPLGQQVRPAGHQTALGDLPLGSALSPDGETMLVSNDGQGTQSLVDTASSQVVQTIPYKTCRHAHRRDQAVAAAPVGVLRDLLRKRRRAERISRMVPSGWAQAPRRSTSPTNCRTRSSVRLQCTSWVKDRASAGRPLQQGPHRPADWSAR